MTGAYHHAQLFYVEMGSCKLFFLCQGWLGTTILLISASFVAWDDRCAPQFLTNGWDGVGPWPVILLISASQVAGITGMSHSTQLFGGMASRGGCRRGGCRRGVGSRTTSSFPFWALSLSAESATVETKQVWFAFHYWVFCFSLQCCLQH
jgi:hypothetical protein